MFTKITERRINLLSWSLTIDWLLLIISLFFEPISDYLTEALEWLESETNDSFVEFKEKYSFFSPYSIGILIFWWMIVPCALIMLLVFGHEPWHRICLFSFLSQISQALKWQRKWLLKDNSCEPTVIFSSSPLLIYCINFLFNLGIKLTLGWLNDIFQPILNCLAVVRSCICLAKNWQSSFQKYPKISLKRSKPQA
jgi:hypothetical protein